MVVAADDLEFLVYFTRTLCVSLPSADASPASLKRLVELRERVPADRLELAVDGVALGDDDAVPTAPAVVRARLTGGLLGGKGGFGAMLRSQGKGSSGKTTTNFGACRDLNGRRLRHVNQEIAMDKWRQESELREQRKKQGVTDRELLDEETPSGIPGWYLATPTWAEGIKKSYMKRRRNTVMCANWLQARADGRTAPPNAPRWWGCPRGRDCDFAHGEDELRGEGLTEYKRQKKDEQLRKKQAELHQYVNYEQALPTSTDMRDAIREGMRNRRDVGASRPAPVVEVPTVELASNQPDQHQPLAITVPDRWLEPVGDSVTTTFSRGLCELRGGSNFGTATVAACRITSGKWYYEVRLVTDDIIQLGWADAASFSANSETGDGVGDHVHSWAYDGARQLKWTGGKEHVYGQEWESGDIIGCLVDVDEGIIQFSRNGELLGEAFSSVKVAKKAGGGLFPAISMEKTEILLVNIGAQPFLYAPAGYKAVAEAIQVPSAPTAPVGTLPSSTVVEKATAKAPVVPEKEAQKEEAPPVELIDLDTISSVEQLEKLGLEGLKQQLQARKLKCGGTLSERAARLFGVKGKPWDEIDPKIKDFKALRK